MNKLINKNAKKEFKKIIFMFLQKNSNTTSGVENKVTDLSISICERNAF